MKIVGISDLHGYLPKQMPECDVICCCGDIVPLDYQRSTVQSVAWFELEFLPWVMGLPCKKFIFVSGNHDFFLEKIKGNGPVDTIKHLLPGTNKRKYNKLVYLQDNSYQYDGVIFYGTPWICQLANWAWYASHDDLVKQYNFIPEKCDVLITHMPPRIDGVGAVLQKGYYNSNTDYGSQELADVINDRPDLKWALSGHVHSGEHEAITNENGTKIVNVSIKDESYIPAYNPFIFEI